MSKETNNVSSSSTGIGFCGLLTIVFITLKLLGITAVAGWSWWWVLSPLWIGFAITIAILLVILLFFLLGIAVMYLLER
jgi:membrane protein YdbS with pleckstrin-like domain